MMQDLKQDQHPEKLQSRFQGAHTNQLDADQEQVALSRNGAQCTAGEPTNMSSGPDLTRCVGGASQAHLRSLAQTTTTQQPDYPANIHDLANSKPSGQTQAEVHQVLDPAQVDGEAQSNMEDQMRVSTGQSCLICRESGHFVDLVDLVSYVQSKENCRSRPETEASSPKNLNNEALLFIELLGQAIRNCPESLQSKLSQLRVRRDCMDRALKQQLPVQELKEAEDPIKLLLTGSFWQQLAPDQLPLVKVTQKSSGLFAATTDDELIGSERPVTQRFNLCNQAFTIDPTSDGRQAQGPFEEDEGVAPEAGIPNEKQIEHYGSSTTMPQIKSEIFENLGNQGFIMQRNQVTPESQKQQTKINIKLNDNSPGQQGKPQMGLEVQKKQPSIASLLKFKDPNPPQTRISNTSSGVQQQQLSMAPDQARISNTSAQLSEAAQQNISPRNSEPPNQPRISETQQIQPQQQNQLIHKIAPPNSTVAHPQSQVISRFSLQSKNSSNNPQQNKLAYGAAKSDSQGFSQAKLFFAPKGDEQANLELGSGVSSEQFNNKQGVQQETLGKRVRRPPNKGYEAMLDKQESVFNSKNKRQKPDMSQVQSISEKDGVSQAQLSHFVNSTTDQQQLQTTLGTDGQKIKLNLVNNQPQQKPQAANNTTQNQQQKSSSSSTDPFVGPFMNEIFKPIMAADKLQVLRQAQELFDVFILPKDLRVFSKDKRDAFLANYDIEEDRALLEAEENDQEEDKTNLSKNQGENVNDKNQSDDKDSNNELPVITQQNSVEDPEGNPTSQSAKNKPKRRKKASNLSRQANRRTPTGSETTWIGNLAKNRKIQEEQQTKGKKRRGSRKSISSKTNSQPSEPSNVRQEKPQPSESSVFRFASQFQVAQKGESKPQPDSLLQELSKEIQEKALVKQDEEGQQNSQQQQVDMILQETIQNHEQSNQQNNQNGGEEDQLKNEEVQEDQVMKEEVAEADKAAEQVENPENEEEKGKQDVNMDEEEEVKEPGAETDEPFVFRNRNYFGNVDSLYSLFGLGYYHRIESLQSDLILLIDNVIRTRCKNSLAREYMNKVKQLALQHLERKKNEFNTKWRHFFDTKFREHRNQHPFFAFEWQKYAGAKRQYFTIDDYKVVTNQDMSKLPEILNQEAVNNLDTQPTNEEYNEVRQKMKTQKKTKCKANCACQDQLKEMKLKFSQTEHLNSIMNQSQQNESIQAEGEDGKCCFHQKVECGRDCGCDPKLCKNRQMTMKQQLVLGKDVEERTAWGMDMCTAFNLWALRPRDVPPILYSEFLEYRLMFAVQQQRADGYDIRKALDFIIASPPNIDQSDDQINVPLDEDQLTLWTKKDDPAQFSYMEKELARIISDAIKNVKGENDPHFRIHSKGLGIFCNKKEGIKKNSLLVEYFGEIYPQWLWYEKQDVLKQGQTKGKLSKDLPDFYNITYERHFDDPDGYDVLTVDPILFGNYASRLSHSCNPNCETITKVKQDVDLYSIGMFSTKSIKYGQELCFNYCSFTESEQEYLTSACLCGSTVCQGRFLNLATAQKNQGLMKEYHTFVDRNLILFNAIVACSPGGEGITSSDQKRLDKFGIKNSVLNGIPEWLKKWASLICEFVEFEQMKYPLANLKRDKPDPPEYVAIELKNLRDSKLSNIAITINKVVRIMKLMGTEQPPLRKMTNREVYNSFWVGQDSIKKHLEDVLDTIEEDCKEVQNCKDFMSGAEIDYLEEDIEEIDQSEGQRMEIDASEPREKDEKFYSDKVKRIRQVLLFMSQELRSVESMTVTIQPLCDNLVLYARTETYFTPNDYSKSTGKEVHIRKCDVAGQASDLTEFEKAIRDQGKTVYKGTKEYQAHHIWGQLVGWYKQTVDKPNSSLSADRRGSLSMPDLHSFIVSARNQDDPSSGKMTGRKARKRDKTEDDDFEEEVMPTMGTNSRRNASRAQASHNKNASTVPATTHDADGKAHLKIIYPHKKYQTREQFLTYWEVFFSKHWDTCCHWSFKNKNRLYGSIQFESVLRANTDRDRRLDYFREVVDELKGYSN